MAANCTWPESWSAFPVHGARCGTDWSTCRKTGCARGFLWDAALQKTLLARPSICAPGSVFWERKPIEQTRQFPILAYDARDRIRHSKLSAEEISRKFCWRDGRWPELAF